MLDLIACGSRYGSWWRRRRRGYPSYTEELFDLCSLGYKSVSAKMIIPNSRHMGLGLDETNLAGLADPTSWMDMESLSPGVLCYLAFVMLPLPELGL